MGSTCDVFHFDTNGSNEILDYVREIIYIFRSATKEISGLLLGCSYYGLSNSISFNTLFIELRIFEQLIW
jgi:hypothetical protein